MSKKIFKEKQRFGGWDVIALLTFFTIGLTYRFVSQHWISPVDDPMSFLTYIVFIIPLASAIWYLINLELNIKMTEKSISVQYSPFSQKKHKVKWKDVEECEIISSNESSRMSGWEVNFDHERASPSKSRRARLLLQKWNIEDGKKSIGKIWHQSN